MPNDDGEVAGRYTVRSVARALRLVGAVAEGPPEGRSLSDLARELGTSKSTTLALARTLSAFGYLREATHGRGYALGTALIRLGDMAGQQIPLRDLCRPLIDELSRETKMTAARAVILVSRDSSSISGRHRSRSGICWPAISPSLISAVPSE